MKEKWAKIPGTDFEYFISNMGRIRSSDAVIHRKNGKDLPRKGKILSPGTNGAGYKQVYLRMNGKKVKLYVHRLVAEAFVPNPEGKDVVNHLDFNPQNNVADNLEWVTENENYMYSYDRGRYAWTDQRRANHRKGMEEHQAKPVIGRRLSDGSEIRYTALNDCKRDGFQPSCVCNCCKGIRATHKGYVWRYG